MASINCKSHNVYYRVNPHLDHRPPKVSGVTMFDVAEIAGTTVINGSHWGDDYIVAPLCQCDQDALESIMAECGIFF